MGGGLGFRKRNEIGERVHDFASGYALVVVSTIFKEREERYIIH